MPLCRLRITASRARLVAGLLEGYSIETIVRGTATLGTGARGLQESAIGISITIAIVTVASLFAGACSQSNASLFPGANQPRVVPDGASVTVVNIESEAAAVPWAEEYCRKLERIPGPGRTMLYRKQRKSWNSVTFDCIHGRGDREQSPS